MTINGKISARADVALVELHTSPDQIASGVRSAQVIAPGPNEQ
jgi:hypothetical protein